MQRLEIDRSRSKFFDPQVQESFAAALPMFRENAKIRTKNVEPLHRVIYAGDLYGYLAAIGVNSKIHWYVLKLNEKDSPSEFGQDDLFLYIPADEEINKFISAITSTGTLKK